MKRMYELKQPLQTEIYFFMGLVLFFRKLPEPFPCPKLLLFCGNNHGVLYTEEKLYVQRFIVLFLMCKGKSCDTCTLFYNLPSCRDHDDMHNENELGAFHLNLFVFLVRQL